MHATVHKVVYLGKRGAGGVAEALQHPTYCALVSTKQEVEYAPPMEDATEEEKHDRQLVREEAKARAHAEYNDALALAELAVQEGEDSAVVSRPEPPASPPPIDEYTPRQIEHLVEADEALGGRAKVYGERFELRLIRGGTWRQVERVPFVSIENEHVLCMTPVMLRDASEEKTQQGGRAAGGGQMHNGRGGRFGSVYTQPQNRRSTAPLAPLLTYLCVGTAVHGHEGEDDAMKVGRQHPLPAPLCCSCVLPLLLLL
jgi:hypothetical protein